MSAPRCPPPRPPVPTTVPPACDSRLGFGLFAAAMTEGCMFFGPLLVGAAEAPRGLHNLLRYSAQARLHHRP